MLTIQTILQTLYPLQLTCSYIQFPKNRNQKNHQNNLHYLYIFIYPFFSLKISYTLNIFVKEDSKRINCINYASSVNFLVIYKNLMIWTRYFLHQLTMPLLFHKFVTIMTKCCISKTKWLR
jgi:hypothetical protein